MSRHRFRDHSLATTETRHVPVKYPRCGAQVPQTPKRRSKRSDAREEAELCSARELENAKSEWTQCSYPRIGWQRLNSCLEDILQPLGHYERDFVIDLSHRIRVGRYEEG
jgi:hypothetical protein